MKTLLKKEIEKLSGDELHDVLTILKNYKLLKGTLGRRGVALFEKKNYDKNNYYVEYYPVLEKKMVQEMAINIYKEVFESEVKKKDITLVENEKIDGGMRVYKNEEVFDVSLARIKKTLLS